MANPPNSAIAISPESLEVANTYLRTQSVNDTSRELGLSREVINDYLKKPEVASYINQMYFDSGYRNRFKLGAVLDSILEKKLLEMQENEVTTSKDIIDVISAMHKMKMEEMKIELKLLEHQRASKPGVQNNIQINGANPFSGTNYGELLENILVPNKE